MREGHDKEQHGEKPVGENVCKSKNKSTDENNEGTSNKSWTDGLKGIRLKTTRRVFQRMLHTVPANCTTLKTVQTPALPCITF